MEEIREKIWETVVSKQQKNRDSLLNKNRLLKFHEGTQRTSQNEIINIANQLKKKKNGSEELSKLKEVFLEDKENIDTFLKVDGALEALVRALSGQNAKQQINAAYCLCNLSLSDKYLRLIKSAGHYLLLHMEGMNSYLVEACTWAVGNLSSHKEECVQLLMNQGALPLLVRLLDHENENIRITAAYAVTHFTYSGYNILKPSDYELITVHAVKFFKKTPSPMGYLLSVLSANKSCEMLLLKESIHIESLIMLVKSMKDKILQSCWYIRIIGNLINESTGQAALQVLTYNVVEGDRTVNLCNALEYLIGSGQVFLMKECCWLLGNLLNHSNEEVGALVVDSNLIQNVSDTVRYFLIEHS